MYVCVFIRVMKEGVRIIGNRRFGTEIRPHTIVGGRKGVFGRSGSLHLGEGLKTLVLRKKS
jgi:hypothetical protein